MFVRSFTRRVFQCLAWLALGSTSLLAACGGGGGASGTSTDATVPTISTQPASLSVVAGASASCTG